MSDTVWSSIELDESLKVISKKVTDMFNVDTIIFIDFLDKYNLSNWKLKYCYSNLVETSDYIAANLTSEERLISSNELFSRSDIKIIEKIQDSKLPDALKKHLQAFSINSMISIPLIKDKSFWGIMLICQNESKKWSKKEINLFTVMASQIYLAVQSSDVYTAKNQIIRRNNLIQNITNKMLESENFEKALDTVSEEIAKIFEVDRVEVRLFDPVLKLFSDTLGEYRISNLIPSNKNKGKSSKELDDFLWKELFEKSKSIIFDSLINAEMPETVKKNFADLSIESAIIFPVLYKSDPIAILFLSNILENKLLKKEMYEILIPISQQIALSINLFQLNNTLTRSLESERVIRNIIIESRELEDYNRIFFSLTSKMSDMFYLDRALLLHSDDEHNLKVYSEFCKSNSLELLLNKTILTAKHTKELEPKNTQEVIILNDVNSEIKNPDLRSYLLEKDISAFLLYSINSHFYSNIDSQKNSLTIMLCSQRSRRWTSSEIESFKLAIDITVLSYLQVQQKKEIEKTRKTFLATLTHDLRSPINSEQKALEVILTGKLGNTLEGFQEYLSDIYKTNEELLRIVNNILMVYHIESGTIQLNIMPNDIKDVISESLHIMRHLAKSEELEIKVSCPDDLPFVLIDRNEVLRVVLNLLSNAIKHNRKGTSVIIRAQQHDGAIEVSIKDNGEGISEADKKNIFQRYPTKKRNIGTGLGLYLSKQIIDSHKGKMWFETEEGIGTTFYFRVPIAQQI